MGVNSSPSLVPMSLDFEELDYAQTPLGELILRRRKVLSLGEDVYEVKLNDAFLMSSLVNDSEVALADVCLDRIGDRDIDVAVGGLGLGYTAQAVLLRDNVKSVVVVEYLAEVINWHTRRLVPASDDLVDDGRCRFVNGDFFALVGNPEIGLDISNPGCRFDAVLVDIDHTPDYWLDESHESFYGPGGLKSLAAQIGDGGVFGLWSAGEPDGRIVDVINTAFTTSDAEVVEFRNPLLNLNDRNTIYIGISPRR